MIQTFDKPIQITYTHTDTTDRSGDAGTFNNKLFMLNYGGSGNLWGIPGAQSNGGRYSSLFNIADGTISAQAISTLLEHAKLRGPCKLPMVNAIP